MNKEMEIALENARELIKKYFEDSDVVDVGWALDTSPEETIEQEFYNMFGDAPTDSDWADMNDSIFDFESQYESILSDYTNGSVADHGHDSDNALVGVAHMTLEEIVGVMESGEHSDNGTYVFTSTSGRFSNDALDTLHECIDATLEFQIPEDLADAIDAVGTKEIREYIESLKSLKG